LRVLEIEDAIRATVPEGEIVIHYDLVVTTRLINDPGRGRTHRYSTPGSDPEISLGKLTAETDRLRADLIQQRSGAAGL
jgi:hypothetical protein